MRFTGRLQDWNEPRGFGFIRPEQGGDDVFVHVSALPSPRPGSEELLSFEVALDRRGRKQAVYVRRQFEHVVAPQAGRVRAARGTRTSSSLLSKALAASGVLAVVLVVALVGSGLVDDYRRAQLVARSLGEKRPFACDARTQCFEMHSCAEAKFFLKNCPGVTMDGDHDGVPCEQSHCTSWLAP